MNARTLAVLVIGATLGAAGCWLSIPSCDDGVREATFPLDAVIQAPAEDGGAGAFRVGDRSYPDCMAYCTEHAVDPVEACAGPGPSGDGGASAVTCRIRGHVCHLPTVVKP